MADNSTPGKFESIPGQGAFEFEYDSDTSTFSRSPGDDFEAISIFDDPQAAETVGSPATLTEVPTSTTNPQRPRTVAAGYNRRSKTLTVVFRDGTWFNYYHVGNLMWKNFRTAYSKGWYLYKSGLDNWPSKGKASMAFVSTSDGQTLAAHARTVQTASGGLQTHGKRPMTTTYMNRLKRADALIKKKNILTPARDRISNPYVQR